jgi:hypothetical protein
LAAYTLLQLVEVLLAGAIMIFGIAGHSPSITVLGGGLLIGKAVLNILAPEGGSVYRRSLIGYGLGAAFVVAAVVVVHFAG